MFLSTTIYNSLNICYIYLHGEVNIGKTIMYTTQLDNGVLNNYAVESKVTYEE